MDAYTSTQEWVTDKTPQAIHACPEGTHNYQGWRPSVEWFMALAGELCRYGDFRYSGVLFTPILSGAPQHHPLQSVVVSIGSDSMFRFPVNVPSAQNNRNYLASTGCSMPYFVVLVSQTIALMRAIF